MAMPTECQQDLDTSVLWCTAHDGVSGSGARTVTVQTNRKGIVKVYYIARHFTLLFLETQ